MTQPNAVASFFTGGGKGISWPDQPPKTVTGTITMVHPPEPTIDPKTQQPTDKMQIRIELSTTERNPEIEFDDGGRTLYVKSYMRSAIGDALKKVGEKEPKIGGTLTVTFTHLEPPERPGLSASKHFSVVYQPPAVTGNFFGQDAAQAAPPQPQYQAPPQQVAMQAPPQQQYIPPQAPAQPQPQYQVPVQQEIPQQMPVQQPIPQPVPQQVLAQQPIPAAAPVAAGPVRPPQISEVAWAQMDETTRQLVSQSVPATGEQPAPF